VIVVDTNVLVYAVRPGTFTEAALRAGEKDPDWVAPAFWRLEMCNVLALAMRVQQLEPGLALEAFAMAESLVEDSRTTPTAEETLRLAHSTAISAYDAEFVHVAEQLGVPLITADRRLIKAFPELTIPLAEFGR